MSDLELEYKIRVPISTIKTDLAAAERLFSESGARVERTNLASARRLSLARLRELRRGNDEQTREHSRAARAAAAEYERTLGQGFFAKLGRAATAGFRSGFKVGGESFGGGSGIGGIAGGALSVATGNLLTGIITGAVDQVKQGIDIGLDFNRLKEVTLLGLRRKLGSERDAEKFFNEVAKFAQDDSPLKIAQAVAQANRLLALNFKPNEIITVLQAAGDAAAGMGKVGEEAQEKVEQITKALSDIRGKQRVNAEELSRQLQEAGVSGWRYISEELRKDPEYARLNESEAIAVARDLAEKNRLSADAVVGIIVKGMAREFSGMGREINLNTLMGQESMTEDLMSVVMGAGTAGIFKHKKTGQRALNQALQSETAGRIAGHISGGTDAALTGVEDALRSLGLNLPKLGAEGAGSYAEGFKSSAPAAYDAGAAVGGAAEKGLRDRLQQNSPSLVMLDLGHQAGFSFVQGLTRALGSEGRRATREEIDKYIKEFSERFKVPEAFVHAIVKNESSYRQYATSHAGAQGLMQLMPGTARRFGVTNSYDARQNVEGGVRYLADLIQMFRGDLRLVAAAYNAGEGRVRQYGGIPPFKETRAYVPRVMDTYERLRQSGGGGLTGGLSAPVPVIIQNLPPLESFFGQFVGTGRAPRQAGPDRPASRDLRGGVGVFSEDFDPQGFARWLYEKQKSMGASERTSVSSQADWQHTVSLMAEEFQISRTVRQQIEGMVARRLEDERAALASLAQLSGATGGSFRPGSDFANITDEQAKRVLEIARGPLTVTQQRSDYLATTVAPRALENVGLVAEKTKAAFEDLPPLIQKGTKDMEAFAKTVSGILGGVAQNALRGDWRGMLQGLRDDFLNWTVQLFEDWVKSSIFKSLTGGKGAAGGGAGGGGDILGSIFGGVKRLFGFGSSAASGGGAAGPWVDPGAFTKQFGEAPGMAGASSAARASAGGFNFAGLGASGLMMGGGMLGSLAGGRSPVGQMLGNAGGTLLGGSLAASLLNPALLPAMFSNPVTAIVGAGLIGGALLFRLFGNRQKTEKALREAIQREYGVRVSEMEVLAQIKQMGEMRFGKGNVRARLTETIHLPEVMELIKQYAESTDQFPKGALAPPAPKFVGLESGPGGAQLGRYDDGSLRPVNADGSPVGATVNGSMFTADSLRESERSRRMKAQAEADAHTRKEDRRGFGSEGAPAPTPPVQVSREIIEHAGTVEHVFKLPDGYVLGRWTQEYKSDRGNPAWQAIQRDTDRRYTGRHW